MTTKNFYCQNCAGDSLEEIICEAVVAIPVSTVLKCFSNDRCDCDYDYNLKETTSGRISHYQCCSCGHILSEAELKALEQQSLNMESNMLRKYYTCYSNSKIKNKLAKIFKRISQKAFREVLTLMVMLKSDNIPSFAKISIMCVLGYLICPLDAMPDFLPVGLIDDIAAVAILMAEMSIYKTPEIEEKVDEIIAQF